MFDFCLFLIDEILGMIPLLGFVLHHPIEEDT